MNLILSSLLFFGYLICAITGYRVLSNDSLKKIAELSQPDTLDINNGRLLKPFLVERVSGTESNAKVRDFIIQHFERLGWHIELDSFTAMTPLGDKNFTNIVVTKEPEAQHRLVLAAHYDSMNSPNFEFIGATDSAVPCAVLLSLAETLNDQLSSTSAWSGGRRKRKSWQDTTTLELIFFDGEEAFVKWTADDSIYGARHLAEIWEQTVVANPQQQQQGRQGNRLELIDVLVLLDLMGTPNLTFHNYFRSTSWLFHHLANLERRLSAYDDDTLWQPFDRFQQPLQYMFPTEPTQLTFNSHAMSDDHLPFMYRGVNILHLIPYPFPKEWHLASDNADCLDPPSIYNLDVLFRVFVCEYLELDPVPHSEL
ncbi:glutaminyl-peptide cyclotransferase-like protein [Halteromyces radiatus]|uniref:glutaminyl-peptide cyclotransferase-like protein n=1 Tax=Halteromyces radiatus TaxID=101107 RepID=UPI002220C15A|nr:glutaminyl-peptide cyclotransferase-like protein [Halteromyces radiatus]KAI8081597.1 glutaminyl-peptide cyclotransferase-like protein [Halteromyces radiatus]